MNTNATWGRGLDRPSGAVLPLVLRKKLREQQQSLGEEGGSSGDTEDVRLVSPPSSAANAVFTAQELEERLLRASVAMVDIQKQLARGEESYFEETNNHGNLFRGWDAFIDAKDVGIAGAGSSAPTSSGGTGGSRRMPADNRWFSGSCRSVSKNTRPAPLYPSKSPVPGTTSATTSLSASVRSESTTPTPAGDSQHKLPQRGGDESPMDVDADVRSTDPKEDMSRSSQQDEKKTNPVGIDEPSSSSVEQAKEGAGEGAKEDTSGGTHGSEKVIRGDSSQNKPATAEGAEGEAPDERKSAAPAPKADTNAEGPASRMKTRKRKAGDS